MQKKIIALAIAAAFSAPAFADTTVYGIVDAAIANISSTGNKSSLNVVSGGLSTSRLGVKAVEDLDNGMKVIAVVEYKLDVGDGSVASSTAASTLASARQKIIALAGGFGTVAAGYAQTTGYDWAVKFDPTAGSVVDSVAATNPANFLGTSSRAPQAIAYISPDLGGVTIAYNHTFNAVATGAVASGATTGNRTTANLLSVMYAGGPLNVGVAYAGTANDDTGFNKTTQMGLGASFDFGVAKLFGTYTSTKTDGTGVASNADKGMSVSVVAPVGPGAIVGTYGKKTMNSTALSDDTTAMTVAYLQGLSKTVTAYGAVQKVNLKTATAVDTTVIAVGLKKAF